MYVCDACNKLTDLHAETLLRVGINLRLLHDAKKSIKIKVMQARASCPVRGPRDTHRGRFTAQ